MLRNRIILLLHCDCKLCKRISFDGTFKNLNLFILYCTNPHNIEKC